MNIFNPIFSDPKRKPVIIFDFDETLVDTSKGLYHEVVTWISANAKISYDEAWGLAVKAYHDHGCCVTGLSPKFGWDTSHKQRFYDEVPKAFLQNIEQHLVQEPLISEKLAILKERTSALGILTRNTKHYVDTALEFTALTSHFVPELVMGRECVFGHEKTSVEAYQRLRQRTTHLGSAPHVMVEDSAPNLPAAKASEFITVFVGDKPIRDEHRTSIDIKYPNIHNVLDDMILASS